MNYRSSHTPRRSIATINDPPKQTVTQGRSFKLLQETLESGKSWPSTTLLTSPPLHARRTSLTNKSPKQTNTIPDKRLIQPTTTDQSGDDKRRQYIRSLSLARDPSAEPLFLSARIRSVDPEHAH